MKKALLAAALALSLASPAWAAPRLAVMYEGRTRANFGDVNAQLVLLSRALNAMGIQYDTWDVSDTLRLPYGRYGSCDSTWFRQNYAAVYVVGAAFLETDSSSWRAFKDADGARGIDKSPINGRWSIPVYVWSNGVLPKNGRNGVYTGSDSIYTWGKGKGRFSYRQQSRLRGTTGGDSLFARNANCGCRTTTFAGEGGTTAVAALATIDTVYTNKCGTGDTLMTAWRYRPTAGLPGVSWSIMDVQAPVRPFTCGSAGVASYNAILTGHLFLLEQLVQESTIRPAMKMSLHITLDNPTCTDSTYGAPPAQSILQTAAWVNSGMKFNLNIKASPSDAAGWVSGNALYLGIDPRRNSGLLSACSDGTMRWSPYSEITNLSIATGWGAGAGSNWGPNHGPAADSQYVRVALWRMFNIATDADSGNGGFPASAFSVKWMPGSGGNFSRWAASVYYQAGGRVARSIFGSDNINSTYIPGDPYVTNTQGMPTMGLEMYTFKPVWARAYMSYPVLSGAWFDASTNSYSGLNSWEFFGDMMIGCFENSLLNRADVSVTAHYMMDEDQDKLMTYMWSGPFTYWFKAFPHIIEADNFRERVLMPSIGNRPSI